MSREALEQHFVRPLPAEDQYVRRLETEFTLIDSFGFTKVFLQVQIIIEILRQKKIPHIIRGSAGCSLVCFLLGITEIDPHSLQVGIGSLYEFWAKRSSRY